MVRVRAKERKKERKSGREGEKKTFHSISLKMSENVEYECKL